MSESPNQRCLPAAYCSRRTSSSANPAARICRGRKSDQALLVVERQHADLLGAKLEREVARKILGGVDFSKLILQRKGN